MEVVEISKGIIAHEVRASGVASGIRESYVVAETQGKIESVSFSLGQYVEKGQLLAQIYKDEVELALKARKSSFLNTMTSLLPDIKIDFPDS